MSPWRAPVGLPPRPGALERVLENRQTVHQLRAVVEEPVDEGRLHLLSEEAHGAQERLAQLVPRLAGDQILPFVYGFR